MNLGEGSIVIEMFQRGGFSTILIGVAAVLLIVVGAERFIWLYLIKSYKVNDLLEGMRPFIINRNYAEALQICSRRSSAPQMAVVKAALLSVENGREAMKSAQGSELMVISEKCEERLPMINLIANVATLLGLLGTITGLITTFNSVAKLDPSQKAIGLGEGIAEAMYSTAAGLMVGITGMVLHSMFSTRADKLLSSSQNAGLKILTWVEQAERKEDRK
jgi:biopolymer transport protein ExbB/TolQ